MSSSSVTIKKLCHIFNCDTVRCCFYCSSSENLRHREFLESVLALSPYDQLRLLLSRCQALVTVR